jgi:hypothetical protein
MGKISPFHAFEMDEQRERNGIEFDTPWGTFTLARAGGSNKRFKTRFNELTAPYRIRGIEIEEIMSDEESKKVLVQCYAETVVLDWREVNDKDGNPIPFSVENAVALFSKFDDLFSIVMQAAQKMSLFRAKVQEEDAKNSQPS